MQPHIVITAVLNASTRMVCATVITRYAEDFFRKQRFHERSNTDEN